MHLCVLHVHVLFARLYIRAFASFFAVHCCMHRFVSAPLSACLVAVTINNILFPETGGVVLWSVKPYTAAECCKDLACSSFSLFRWLRLSLWALRWTGWLFEILFVHNISFHNKAPAPECVQQSVVMICADSRKTWAADAYLLCRVRVIPNLTLGAGSECTKCSYCSNQPLSTPSPHPSTPRLHSHYHPPSSKPLLPTDQSPAAPIHSYMH